MAPGHPHEDGRGPVLTQAPQPAATTAAAIDRHPADVRTAKDYYDSEDAFAFYKAIWGGELIHVGLYTPQIQAEYPKVSTEQVRAASQRSLDNLLETTNAIVPLVKGKRVCDFGGAYGGAARYIAKKFGCEVVSVDISAKACQTARELTKKAALESLVTIKEASFTETGEPDASVDVVMSQDALMHLGEFRAAAVKEAARILKPGGVLVFMDPMQTDTCNATDMAPIYDRIRLKHMASVSFYQSTAASLGLQFVSFTDFTPYLATHYETVRQILLEKKHLLGLTEKYVRDMEWGLRRWVEGVGKGNIQYGLLVFKKSE